MRTSFSLTRQLDGLLLIDKPAGLTSHDVVDFVRRQYGQKKAGHCGTLDPLATGLLMVVLGRATKVQDLLMAEDKEYEGTLKLGETTDSQDADGKQLEVRPVPALSEQELRAAFDRFMGEFYQTPPMVSAVKQGGVPLYKLAREGKVVPREPRLVRIDKYDLLAMRLPWVDFKIRCSKGFYVRTYCSEIGELLGCGAHLVELRRTRSGNFRLEQAVGWRELESNNTLSFLENHLLSLPEISKIRRG